MENKLKENINSILNKKIAIQCESKDEAKVFIESIKLLNDNNTIVISTWDENKENTCFDINNNDYIASFASNKYYSDFGYKMMSFKTFKEGLHMLKPKGD